jgi:pilus assembly protein CpaC
LVTLSGQTATFLAGGEFAVPTVVGVEGAAAATTTFRGFGTQLSFTPTVIDKDRIRLRVQPSFSTINGDNTVNGIPGLDTRTVTTQVDLREGQWLAIAGLIQDQQAGTSRRLPWIGEVPVLGALFSHQTMRREETELIVLVSPELVHPMEAQQVPLILPGMDVTEPTDKELYLHQRIEGDVHCQHRGTVWPEQRFGIYRANHEACRAAKRQVGYQKCQNHYVLGPHGFSE